MHERILQIPARRHLVLLSRKPHQSLRIDINPNNVKSRFYLRGSQPATNA
jgi:hypothetical protein